MGKRTQIDEDQMAVPEDCTRLRDLRDCQNELLRELEMSHEAFMKSARELLERIIKEQDAD